MRYSVYPYRSRVDGRATRRDATRTRRDADARGAGHSTGSAQRRSTTRPTRQLSRGPSGLPNSWTPPSHLKDLAYLHVAGPASIVPARPSRCARWTARSLRRNATCCITSLSLCALPVGMPSCSTRWSHRRILGRYRAHRSQVHADVSRQSVVWGRCSEHSRFLKKEHTAVECVSVTDINGSIADERCVFTSQSHCPSRHSLPRPGQTRRPAGCPRELSCHPPLCWSPPPP
jgi:hypothetical protein